MEVRRFQTFVAKRFPPDQEIKYFSNWWDLNWGEQLVGSQQPTVPRELLPTSIMIIKPSCFNLTDVIGVHPT
ncbi:hypothetical protein ACTXT7_009132 [Hymenolepis weldensis]